MSDVQLHAFEGGGRPLAGSFLLRASLGEGRFGPVHLAYDQDGNRPVVVRTFTRPLEAHERGRLLEAFRWLCDQALDHPALGRPLASGLYDERPFLVHSYLQGLPLDEFLGERGSQSPADVVTRVTQLADAVDCAAAAGIHHGAIRGRDVILGRDGSGLGGVGLVQALAMAELYVETRGSYARPWRAAGDLPSRFDDIYALGVVALQLLRGRPVTVPPSAEVLAELPPMLRVVIGSVLGSEERDRPATALEFAAALQRAVGASPESGILAFHSETDDTGLDVVSLRPERPSVQLDFELGGTARPASPGVVLAGAVPAGPAGDPDVGMVGMVAPALADRPVGDVAGPTLAPRVAAPPLDPLMMGAHHTRTGEDAPHALAKTVASDWMEIPHRMDDPVLLVDRFDDHSSDRFVQDERVVPPATRREAATRGSRAPIWLGIVAAVAVIGIVAGFAGGYFAGQLSEPVPFPRTAARPGIQGPAPGARASDAGNPGSREEAPALDRGELRQAELPGRGTLPDAPTVINPEPLRGAGEPEDEARPVRAVSVPPGAAADSEVPPVTVSPSRSGGLDASPGSSARIGRSPLVEQGSSPGRILVRSTPAGARVWVNGEPRGTTPLAVRELALTGHTITVTHPAYATRQERVTLTAAVPARSIDFDLDRPGPATVTGPASTTGALHIESRPSGAQVFVNGRLIGSTPLLLSNVSTGSHLVQLELPGYRRWSRSISVGLGERAHVAASLEP
jgi:hypothetical protein